MSAGVQKNENRVLKGVLLSFLVAFTLAAVVFSIYILFTDFNKSKPVSTAQAHGMFTVFVSRDIQEVMTLRFPSRVKAGKEWRVTDIDFKNDHLADVEATDGDAVARFEFIFSIEESNVRVLLVSDVTNRALEDAYYTLIRYLDALRGANYTSAASYYGGSLSRLLPYGDGGSDVAMLLKGYCEQVSPAHACLAFEITDKIRDPATKAYKFNVRYTMPDGSVYALANGVDEFRSIVEPRNDSYYVLTLPFD